MILLDTNALIWMETGHRRVKALGKWADRLYLSPASLLEIQLLVEVGKLRLSKGLSARVLGEDDRWKLDNPPAVSWFEAAHELSWTRDPFDRLLVAHARYRGWRLATGDELLLEQLGPAFTVEL